ncbi:MAG: redoxin domain-containing protein [Bacteroidales bacterium]|nr:redoxin domain-containing protein [Bacteroidales bacterium]
MIRYLSLIVTCLLCVNLTAQNSYKVSFFIHDYNYDSIYIEGYCGSKTSVMDSLKVSKDGGFHWTAVNYPMGMYMVKSPKGDLFSFLLDISKDFSIEIYQDGEFFVKNSTENDAYFLYQKENKKTQTAMYYYKIKANAKDANVDSLRRNIDSVIDDFQTFQRSFFKTYPYNLITVVTDGMNQSAPSFFFENGALKKGMERQYAYYYRKHYWDRFHFKDRRILYTPYFIKQFNIYISEITEQIPDTVCNALDEFVHKADSAGGKEYADYVIAWYLDNLPRLPFSFNEIIYSHVIKKYLDRASSYLPPSMIEFHQQNIEKIEPFLPGNQMPNVVLRDFENNVHRLYSLKKQYTVLYFFSTECESCKKNLDELKSFYKDYKDKYDVEIYSIDIDPDYAMSKARQSAEPFDWIVTHATVEELSAYNFQLDHTPSLFILDENKRILNKTALYEHVKKSIEFDYNTKHKQ